MERVSRRKRIIFEEETQGFLCIKVKESAGFGNTAKIEWENVWVERGGGPC